MSIKLDISAELDAQGIIDLIKEYAERQTGKRVTKVDIKFKVVGRGGHAQSSGEHVLDKAVITFADAPAIPLGPIHRSSLASQTEAVESRNSQWGDR